ncbi:MAG: hypothetical protein V4819_10535 [Verrucomicrobiota bacterium]
MNEALSKPVKRRPVLFAFITIVCVFGAVESLNLIENRRSLTTCRRSTTQATVTAIEMAVISFYTEYGAMPDVRSRVRTNAPEGVKLLRILLGLEMNAANRQNPRGIKFLNVKEGKDNRNGLVYSSTTNIPEGIYDKWGNPYTVELDADYNEELHFTVASRTVDLKGRRVAAYSPGQDKKLGTADDVKNW